MNKEEYEKIIENLNKDATHLLELHKKDKEKIEKAIEYIKEHTTLYTSYLGKPKVVPKIELQREAYDKLLEILKGEPNERRIFKNN